MGDSPVVGSVVFEIRATRDKLKDDIRLAERDLKEFGDKVERDASQTSSSIGRSTRMIGVAVAALSAVFTVAITGAFALGRASLKMAEDMSNSAHRIGISTSALQEWQYVARKTGEDANAVGGALETFASKLAAAAAGLSKEDLKNFQALGLSQEQLKGMNDTEKALDEIVDRIGDLKDESDRAAIAEKLGLGPLATSLREGSDEVARLRDEARALGFVMSEELIAKGAAASEQMDDLSQIIGIQMAEAFISLSDEVLAFTGHIADALGGLNRFIERFDGWRERISLTYPGLLTAMGNMDPMGAMRAVGDSVRSGNAQRMTDAYNNPQIDVDDPALLRQQMATDAARSPERTRRTPNFNPNLTPVSGRTRADNSAQRAAEREARRAERVEQEIFRARQRLLQVAEDDVLTAQQRFDLAQDQLRLDRDARDAEIASKAERGEIKDAERRMLEAANAQADAMEDRILTDSAFREIEDERLATERLMAGLASDLLSLQSGAARTAKERQAIELELLEIAQRQRREALRLELERDPSKTPGQRAEAMATNGRIDAAERDAIIRNNLSPLEAWRDQSLKTADEISEAYESIAARGLDSLNDGIVDAIMNSRSLGEVFHNVARQILADLLSISVRRGITEPLVNALFGGGKGGSGGWMGAIGSFFGATFGGGRAAGGPMMGGNWYRAGEHGPENIFMPKDGIAIPNVRSANSSGGAAQRPLQPVVFDLRGAVMTADLVAQMNEIGAKAQSGAVRQSVDIVRRSSAGMQQRQSRLGTV